MTNLNAIYVRFITVAETFIGDRLAPVPQSGGGTTPAIFIKKDPFHTASYPFITVNIADIGNSQSTSVYEYGDVDSRKTISLRDLTVTYNIFSSDSAEHSAEQIAFDLKQKFTRQDVHRLFNADGLGEIKQVFGAPLNSFKRDNEVGEMASLTIIFTVAHEESNDEFDMNAISTLLRLRYPEQETDILSTQLDIDLTE